MSSPLIKKANEEADAIRRDLPKYIPKTTPVTVLLYQPPTGEHEGRFIDVGPRPEKFSDTEPVFQSIMSGASGAILADPQFALRFTPIKDKISKSDLTSYVENNPADQRKRQVLLEKTRHSKDIKWARNDATPIGNFIHHLSITPSVTDLFDPKLPAFGYVYTITKDGNDDQQGVQDLVHAAQIAARVIGLHRIKEFLGNEQQELIRNIQKGEFSSIWAPTDEFSQLAIRFLFFHHWFYPHSTNSLSALMALGINEDVAKGLYQEFGWQAPPDFSLAECNLADFATMIADDFRHLPTESPPVAIRKSNLEYLSGVFSSSLIYFSDRLSSIIRDRHDETLGKIHGQLHRDAELVTLFPKTLATPLENLHIPIFFTETIFGNLKKRDVASRRKIITRPLLPDPQKLPPRNAYIKPYGWITSVTRVKPEIEVTIREYHEQNDRISQWTVNFVRCGIEKLIVNSSGAES